MATGIDADSLETVLAQGWKPDLTRLSLGIYEKALPAALTWPERLAAAERTGFDFVEISIDESDERLARLDWGSRERGDLRHAVQETGVPIQSLVLSAHRSFPLGSASAATRQQARDILRKAIDFSLEVGIRLILIGGADVYIEPSTARTEVDFLLGLEQGLEWASAAGMMLALENSYLGIDALRKARRCVDYFQSPWFQLYVDLGNLAYTGQDVVAELEAGRGHVAAEHFKDTRRGQLQHVPLGEGEVPFVAACAKLAEMGFQGQAAVEMWTGANPNAMETALKQTSGFGRRSRRAGDCLYRGHTQDEG